MQKVINLLALLSFAVSAGVVGAGAYVYLNKDALIEKAKEKAAEVIGPFPAESCTETEKVINGY